VLTTTRPSNERVRKDGQFLRQTMVSDTFALLQGFFWAVLHYFPSELLGPYYTSYLAFTQYPQGCHAPLEPSWWYCCGEAAPDP
jgi:hypothetical protein